MMRAALALLMALAAAPAAAAQPPPLTWSRLHAAPDEELVRHMFGDLAAFPVVSNRPEARPTRYMARRASIWFWTRPRASDHYGLCETDRLIVTFEAPPLSGLADPVMAPRRFDLKTYFIVLDRARAREARRPDTAESIAQEPRCAALDPRRDSIPADYGGQLMQAFALVAALGDGARAGRAPAPLDCSAWLTGVTPPADEATCLRELVRLRESSAVWVDRCHGGPPLGNCIRVLAPPWFIHFELDQRQVPVRIVVEGIEDTSSIE